MLTALACVGAAHSNPSTGIVETPCTDCSSSPTDLTAAGDYLYFSADDGIHGRELWRLDRDEVARLTADLRIGPESSQPTGLTAAEGHLFFFADSGPSTIGGHQLWVIAPGNPVPELLTDLPGTLESSKATAVGEHLFFDAHTPDHGRELWISDGTRTGTRLHSDILPGTADGIPGLSGIALGNDRLVAFGMHLAGDGSPLPMIFLAEAARGSAAFIYFPQGRAIHVSPGHFVYSPFGGGILLSAGHSMADIELVHLDGSPSVLPRLIEIRKGSKGALPQAIVATETGAFARADDGVHGYELWFIPNTGAPRLIRDIALGAQGSGPHKLTPAGDRVFFVADSEPYGSELWVSDGTESGTRLVIDLMPGPNASEPYSLTNLGDRCLFSGYHETHGEELWITDGTRPGTTLLRDIHPGDANAEPYYLAKFNDRVYFSARDAAHGEELWVTDGTPEGTRLVIDILSALRRSRSSEPHLLTAWRNELYFTANDGVHGRELWRSAGSKDSTRLLADLAPGVNDGGITNIWVANDTLYIERKPTDARREIWQLQKRTGELRVFDGSPPPIETQEQRVYSGADDAHGAELWIRNEDGTDAHLLRDCMPGPAGSFPSEVIYASGAWYFRASAPSVGDVLWKTDGTSGNTQPLRPGGIHIKAPRNLVPYRDGFALVCTVVDGTHQLIYFASSEDVRPLLRTTSSTVQPADLTVVGDTLYFTYDDGWSGVELWMSGGDHYDAVMVEDIASL